MEIAYSEALRQVEKGLCPRRSVTPPNRLETTNRDLLLALATYSRGNKLDELRTVFRRYFSRGHVCFAPSCRSAIAQVLTLLPQQDVVMPAFTCPVVKTAVVLAGKRIIYVDCAPGGLNATSIEFEKEIRPGRILLPTHLFGLPTDVERICALARQRHCITIEDAAAAFGARRHGQPLGTFGDFGVVSFERSKRLPAFRGAVILVNNETLIDPETVGSHRLVGTTHALPLNELVGSFLYNAATVPWIYGHFTVHQLLSAHRSRVASEDRKGVSAAFDTPFYRREFHPYQANLVLRALMRVNEIRERVANLVAVYRDRLAGSDVQMFTDADCDDGALLRFPVAFPGRERGDILRRALARGLYLETNYERILPDSFESSAYPNAEWAARNLLLLPLYRRLPVGSAEYIADEVLALSKEASVVAAA